ncbi:MULTISPECIES: hypothetical protein [Microbacterium]|uniref:hypothetical protein n=1 Tax=Microbacterium TaxID=33882 RepID=UPI00146DA94C|nr:MULTISPECIES: hypothetical protein [Microbacterium]
MRRARGWAITGGAVLLAGIIAIIITAAVNQQDAQPGPSKNPQPSSSPTSPSTEPGGDTLVDAGAVQNGWRGEPVTTDSEVYVVAALEAAATFDTTKASHEDWLEYLDSWFTPDTRYTSTEDQQTELEAARLELRQGVVLPEREWNSLAAEDGRVAATAGDVVTVPVTDDASGDMVIGTADGA